ncbi:MAG: hypothetical protein ACRBF0_13965 [Calditrichia bacterium]
MNRLFFTIILLGSLFGNAQNTAPGKNTPPLKLINTVNNSKEIVINQHFDSFYYPLRLLNESNKPVKSLTFIVSDLISLDNHTRTPLHWSPVPDSIYDVKKQPWAIEPKATIDIDLKAMLAHHGNYFGTISWHYINPLNDITIYDHKVIKINRSRKAAAVSILGVESVRSEITLGNPEMWMILQNNTDKQVVLNYPTFTTLTKKVGENQIQANYKKLTIESEDSSGLPSPFILPGNTNRRIKLIPNGLGDAGEYNGVVRVSGQSFEPVEKTFKIYLKKSYWIASFFIFLGIAFSILLNYFKASLRPQLLWQRRLTIIREKLQLILEKNNPDDEEKSVIKSLYDRSTQLSENLAWKDRNKNENQINDLEVKVSLLSDWLDIKKRIRKLEPAELRTLFHEDLEQVRIYLLSVIPLDADNQKISAILNGFDSKRREAIQANLQLQIEAFEKELQEQKSKSIAEAIKPIIDRAKNELINQNLEAARVHIDKARLKYAQLLGKAFRKNLPSETPIGVDEKDWQGIKTSLEQNLDKITQSDVPQEASQLFTSSAILYFDLLLNGLKKEAEQQHNTAESDEKYQELTPHWQNVLDMLKEANIAIKAQQFQKVNKLYTNAQKDFLDLTKQMSQKRASIYTRSTNEVVFDAQWSGHIPSSAVIPELISKQLEKFKQPKKSSKYFSILIKYLDIIFLFILAIIAVILGLKFFWVDNPSWGSVKDYFVALLWGLGLHKVTEGTFEGFKTLKSKYN